MLHLLKYDDDDFNKWQVSEKLHFIYIHEKLNKDFFNIIKRLIEKNKLNKYILSYILEPPSIEIMIQKFNVCDPLELY